MFKSLFLCLGVCISIPALAGQYQCSGTCTVYHLRGLSCHGNGHTCEATCYQCMRLGRQCSPLGNGYLGCSYAESDVIPEQSFDSNLSVAQQKIFNQCVAKSYCPNEPFGKCEVRSSVTSCQLKN